MEVTGQDDESPFQGRHGQVGCAPVILGIRQSSRCFSSISVRTSLTLPVTSMPQYSQQEWMTVRLCTFTNSRL